MLGHALFAAGEGVAGEGNDEAWGAEPVEEAFAGAALSVRDFQSGAGSHFEGSAFTARRQICPCRSGCSRILFRACLRACYRACFGACFRACFGACLVQATPLLPKMVEVIGITN